MNYGMQSRHSVRFVVLFFTVFLTIVAFLTLPPFQAAGHARSIVATYSHGVLHFAIPYQAARDGAGKLTIEVLDPEDHVMGSAQQQLEIRKGKGQWEDDVNLDKHVPVEDLVWHRVRYRFEYDDHGSSALEGTESISQILLRPVVHILGQETYLSGGPAAVRVIVSDSKD